MLWFKLPYPGSLPIRALESDPNIYTWDDWRKDMQRRYPIRYWLQETLPLFVRCNVTKPIDNAVYWLKSHTYRRYHMLDMRNEDYGYRWGWIDRSEAIFVAAFNLLRDFVDREEPFKYIDWDASPPHKDAAREIKELYDWWTCGRKSEHEAAAKLFDQDRELWHRTLDELDARDDAMLGRLIKVRHYLWT